MAVIGLEGVHFHADHGYHLEERFTGNRFVLDVYVDTKIGDLEDSGNIKKTVNYETIYFICQSVFKEVNKASADEREDPPEESGTLLDEDDDNGGRINLLLETLAQRIVNKIENQFEDLRGVRLRLNKINPPLDGKVDRAVVEISTGVFRIPHFILEAIQDSDVLDDFPDLSEEEED